MPNPNLSGAFQSKPAALPVWEVSAWIIGVTAQVSWENSPG